jgi:hypothetical protein
VITATKSAEVDHHGQYYPDKVDPGDGQPAIDDPRVHQRRQREKDESQKDDQEAMVGAIQIVGEKVQHRKDDSREREDQDQEDAGHRLEFTGYWTHSTPGRFRGSLCTFLQSGGVNAVPGSPHPVIEKRFEFVSLELLRDFARQILLFEWILPQVKQVRYIKVRIHHQLV